jgi:hypothetical protein
MFSCSHSTKPYRFSRVITAYVNKADEYTPNLEELILRHFVPAWRCDIEPRLPASLKHLDLFRHSLSQDQLTAMITPASSDKIPTAPFPRFSKLNVGSKETCVKAEPTMLFQFFRNGHHPWESLKLAFFGDDASHSEILSQVNAAHIVLQSQPFLKILDISSIRWMTPDCALSAAAYTYSFRSSHLFAPRSLREGRAQRHLA